jgi:hypothetical protein
MEELVVLVAVASDGGRSGDWVPERRRNDPTSRRGEQLHSCSTIACHTFFMKEERSWKVTLE